MPISKLTYRSRCRAEFSEASLDAGTLHYGREPAIIGVNTSVAAGHCRYSTPGRTQSISNNMFAAVSEVAPLVS